MNCPAKETFHIAIFARSPVPGATKTRLIPLLGPEGAAHAHCQMLHRALQTAVRTAGNQVSLWQAGEDAAGFLQHLAADTGLACCRQSGADLGERMANCLRHLATLHPAVILIGSDAPVLSVQDIGNAIAGLAKRAKMVFAPAEDGGYVLVGVHRRTSGAEITQMFNAIDWGTSAVMAQTRTRAAELGWKLNREVIELATRWDVDEPVDFVRAANEGLLEWPPGNASASPGPFRNE